MLYYNLEDENIEEQNLSHEIIQIFEGDDVAREKVPQSGDILGVLPLKNMVLFPSVLLQRLAFCAF